MFSIPGYGIHYDKEHPFTQILALLAAADVFANLDNNSNSAPGSRDYLSVHCSFSQSSDGEAMRTTTTSNDRPNLTSVIYDILRVRCIGPSAGAKYFEKLYIIDRMCAGSIAYRMAAFTRCRRMALLLALSVECILEHQLSDEPC